MFDPSYNLSIILIILIPDGGSVWSGDVRSPHSRVHTFQSDRGYDGVTL